MTDVPQDDGHRAPRRDVLASLALVCAAPMCLGTALALAFAGLANTVSSAPLVLYWVFSALSIAAVVLAIIARRRTAHPRIVRWGFGLGVMGILAALVLPRPVFTAHEQAVRMTCRHNLEKIGAALLAYSERNGGQFAPRLQTLVHTGTPAKLFICPSASHKGRAFNPRDVDATGDYCYGRATSDEVPPTVPLVWDRSANHAGGGNMCFVDGHAEWRSPESYTMTNANGESTITPGDMRTAVESALPYYVTTPELPPPAGTFSIKADNSQVFLSYDSPTPFALTLWARGDSRIYPNNHPAGRGRVLIFQDKGAIWLDEGVSGYGCFAPVNVAVLLAPSDMVAEAPGVLRVGRFRSEERIDQYVYLSVR
jgi:prepilin-type processing-associated H-X9-DG protein